MLDDYRLTQELTNTDAFKNQLKTHRFKLAYECVGSICC